MIEICRSFDLGRCERDPIAFLQDLIRGTGLAIDADEIVAGSARRDLLFEQLSDGETCFDFDRFGEATAIVVDHEDFHEGVFLGVDVEKFGSEQETANIAAMNQRTVAMKVATRRHRRCTQRGAKINQFALKPRTLDERERAKPVQAAATAMHPNR